MFRFIRQLHFYGFTKSETVGGKWTFSHPKFNKFEPDKVLEITRKTRMTGVSFATKDEVAKMRFEMNMLKQTYKVEVGKMNEQLDQLSQMVQERLKQVTSTKQIIREERKDTRPVQIKKKIARNTDDFFLNGYEDMVNAFDCDKDFFLPQNYDIDDSYSHKAVTTKAKSSASITSLAAEGSAVLDRASKSNRSSSDSSARGLKRCWSMSSKSTIDADIFFKDNLAPFDEMRTGIQAQRRSSELSKRRSEMLGALNFVDLATGNLGNLNKRQPVDHSSDKHAASNETKKQKMGQKNIRNIKCEQNGSLLDCHLFGKTEYGKQHHNGSTRDAERAGGGKSFGIHMNKGAMMDFRGEGFRLPANEMLFKSIE